jgi:hypothetical protein
MQLLDIARFGGLVHAGFYNALHYIYDEILDYIQANLKDRKLLITGHSLGGALAALAGIQLKVDRDIEISGIYTFGEPKVGDDKFAHNFEILLGKKLFRFVNNNDIVPRVPFSIPHIFKYVQIGQIKYFDSDGILNDDINRMDSTWETFEGSFVNKTELIARGKKDHAMVKYLKLLDNARGVDNKSEIEQLLIQAVSQLQSVVKTGYKNIPILDPYKIDKELKFSKGDIKLELENPTIKGFSTIQISELPHFSLKNKELSFGISFDRLVLESMDYSASYKIISRSGNFELEAKGVKANFTLELDFQNHLPVVATKNSNFEIDSLDLEMENIYILDLIAPLFKNSFEEMIAKRLQGFINEFLTRKIQTFYLSQKDTLLKLKKLYDMKLKQSGGKIDEKPRILEGFNGVGELPLPLFWELPSVDVENSKSISIDEVVQNAKTGDIILFAGSYPSSKRIRRLTQSCFSHVVFVVKEPDIADGKACVWQATSSVHRGVLRNMEHKSGIQLNYLDEMVQDYRDEDSGAIICWRQLNRESRDDKLEQESLAKVKEFIKEMDGKPYTNDMDGLYIMGLMEVDNPNKEDYFCAGIVAESQMRFNILKDTFYQYQYAPRDFSERQDRLPFKNGNSSFGEQIVIRD